MFHYEKALIDNGKSYNDLPKSLKQKVNMIKARTKKAESSKNAASLKEGIERSDVALYEEIQNWAEEGLPSPPPSISETEEEKNKKAAAADAAKAAADKAAADEAEEKRKKIAADQADQAKKGEIITMRNAIVEKMNADPERFIHKRDLKNILGREPANRETIGDLSLIKIWMSEKYKKY